MNSFTPEELTLIGKLIMEKLIAFTNIDGFPASTMDKYKAILDKIADVMNTTHGDDIQ